MTAYPKTVLIIEDDHHTADLIAVYFEREGFRAVKRPDGAAALSFLHREIPDIVILDLMIPEIDGWEVCRRLRKTSDVPVIMLTARGDEIDRVSGLTMGADDYVVKPFSPRELVARAQAVLRRTGTGGSKRKVFSHKSLRLDSEKRRVSFDGNPVQLTPHEFVLLERLISAPGRTFTRPELLSSLYPRREATVIDRVVDVHIGKLRQKIEPDPANPAYILTERGLGYRFDDPHQ
jgi:DNA-binding response OmpR family regulator